MGRISYYDIVGRVHVLAGSMWTRKTDELIAFAQDLSHASVGYAAVNSAINGRDTTHGEIIRSRTGKIIQAKVLNKSSEIPRYIATLERERGERVSTLIVDEGNFWDRELPTVLTGIARKKRAVLVGGLDLDFRGNPFGPMGDLMQLAGPENVEIFHGYCMIDVNGRPCGKKSSYTGRFLSNSGNVAVHREGKVENGLSRAPYFDRTIRDGDSPYAILCEEHFEVPYKEEVLEIAEFVDEHPGRKREAVKRRFESTPNIEEILNFLVNDEVARMVIETNDGELFTKFD